VKWLSAKCEPHGSERISRQGFATFRCLLCGYLVQRRTSPNALAAWAKARGAIGAHVRERHPEVKVALDAARKAKAPEPKPEPEVVYRGGFIEYGGEKWWSENVVKAAEERARAAEAALAAKQSTSSEPAKGG